jgi:hypothetical protein
MKKKKQQLTLKIFAAFFFSSAGIIEGMGLGINTMAAMVPFASSPEEKRREKKTAHLCIFFFWVSSGHERSE